MPRILVTNDDGVHAEGIRALAAAVAPFGEVTVVAPIQESSAIGHALTLRRPLRIEEVSPSVYAVDGTPTDCVNIGMTHILRAKPDLIVSGINSGWNLGDDVTYSGTVSGALEGALLSIPSIAVSAERRRNIIDYEPAALAAATAVEAVLARGLPKFTLLNINVPAGGNRGFRVTVQARRNHVTVVSERTDPRQKAVLLDRGGRERVGAARSLGLPGGPRRLHLGHAAPARHDGARRPGLGRGAGAVAAGRRHRIPASVARMNAARSAAMTWDSPTSRLVCGGRAPSSPATDLNRMPRG